MGDFNDSVQLTFHKPPPAASKVPAGPGETQFKKRLSLLCADNIAPQPYSWLWWHWLARGKFHLVAGLAGCGKTTLALALAAIVSRGGKWPDGSKVEPSPGNVVIWSGEDDYDDTIVPRLIAAGADMSRIYFVGTLQEGESKRGFDPARDIDALKETIREIGNVALIIIDPIVSAVTGDSHKNAEVRRSLQPLVDLASGAKAALIGISHFSKGTTGHEPLERVTGSLAFTAIARIVFIAAKKRSGDGSSWDRIFARCKSNIGPDGNGFGYTLAQTLLPDRDDMSASVVRWGNELLGDARALLDDAEQDPENEGKLEEAKQFLRAELASGPVLSTQVSKAAAGVGIAKTTLERAKKALGIVSEKDVGADGHWRWRLPQHRQDTQGRQEMGVGNSEDLTKIVKNPHPENMEMLDALNTFKGETSGQHHQDTQDTHTQERGDTDSEAEPSRASSEKPLPHKLPELSEGMRSSLQRLPPDIAEGITRLGTMPTPAGWDDHRWDAAIGGMKRFVAAGWPQRALALGWDATELFGLLPAAPIAIDAMGLGLLLGSADVMAIDERGADILTHSGRIERDRHQRFCRRVGGRQPRLAWEISQ